MAIFYKKIGLFSVVVGVFTIAVRLRDCAPVETQYFASPFEAETEGRTPNSKGKNQ